jgi:hypothetical protein
MSTRQQLKALCSFPHRESPLHTGWQLPLINLRNTYEQMPSNGLPRCFTACTLSLKTHKGKLRAIKVIRRIVVYDTKDEENILELWTARIRNAEQTEIQFVTARELLGTDIVYMQCPESLAPQSNTTKTDAAISYSCMELSLRLFLVVVLILIFAPAFIPAK